MRVRRQKDWLQDSPENSSVRASDSDPVLLPSGCGMYDESITIGRYFMPLFTLMMRPPCAEK